MGRRGYLLIFLRTVLAEYWRSKFCVISFRDSHSTTICANNNSLCYTYADVFIVLLFQSINRLLTFALNQFTKRLSKMP